MQQTFGYELPKAMHPEFGALVKAACDKAGRELKAEEIFDIFRTHYLEVKAPYNLKSYKLYEENTEENKPAVVHFEGKRALGIRIIPFLQLVTDLSMHFSMLSVE